VSPNSDPFSESAMRLTLTAINLTPMADLDDFNHSVGVVDRVKNAVISLADAIPGLFGHFLTAERARIGSQTVNTLNDFL